MEKTQKTQQPADPGSWTHDLDLVVRRCPFCHEGLSGKLQDVVSCAACDARHHTSCWDEHGACASCGAAARLVLERHARRPAHRHPRAGLRLLAVGLTAFLIAFGLSVLSYARGRAQDQRALAQALEAEQRAHAEEAARRAEREQLRQLAREEAAQELAKQRAKVADEERAQREARQAQQRAQAERTAAARALRLWSGLGIRGTDAGYFEGVRVDDVRPDSPAARAGLQPGDHVQELLEVSPGSRSSHNACTLQLLDGVLLLFVDHDDGSSWSLRIVRDGVEQSLPLPAE